MSWLTAFLHLPSRASRQIFYMPGPMLHLLKLKHTPHKIHKKNINKLNTVCFQCTKWTKTDHSEQQFNFVAFLLSGHLHLGHEVGSMEQLYHLVLQSLLHAAHLLGQWGLGSLLRLWSGLHLRTSGTCWSPGGWPGFASCRILFGLPLMGDSGIPKINK